MGKSKDTPLKYEQAIEEIESITQRIESGQCGLEECIAQWEKGKKLLAHCSTILDSAQKRIDELTADAQGKLLIKDGQPLPDESVAEVDDDDPDAA